MAAPASFGYNKRVAIVYFSAALLIVSVGVRMVGSLMSEGGQELAPLDWVMIIGIALEFFVLTYYSSFIWSQPEEPAHTAVHTSPSDPAVIRALTDAQMKITVLTEQHVSMVQQIKEMSAHFQRSAETMHTSAAGVVQDWKEGTSIHTEAIRSAMELLARNEEALKVTTQEVIGMERTLKEFVEGKIKEQVQKEVAEILAAAVSQRMIGERKS